MKKKNLYLFLLLCFVATSLSAQPKSDKYAYDLNYFLPKGIYSYDTNIPEPKSVLGFELGQQHVNWGQVVDYMKTLSTTSSRVIVKETGRTYEHRPFIEVVITSSANQKKLEQLRDEHLKMSAESPLVISLVYSIHGNEPSGVNSSLATAYFLAAAKGPEIDSLLANTIIVLTPGANPDGINRFASWVNTSRSLTDVSDVNSREFQEAWPSSRTNHYWADCNRDLLMAQHPEGINGLKVFFEWMPNVVADQHEQGSEHPFYFSPGDARRTNPLTSQLNQDLTSEISSSCAKEFDKIGTAYYSKEGYDDYYYGKAAAYGDIHGSVCLLYEQGSTRGHLRETSNGIRSFAWTIRNQVMASYATIMSGYNMKDRLLHYQKDFYKASDAESKKDKIKGYIFNTRGSKSVNYHFLENLNRHHIDVYHLEKDFGSFKKEDSYVIPLEQKYSLMVRTLMEDSKNFTDSIFYDISAWTFPYAFNLSYKPIQQVKDLLGDKVVENTFRPGQIIGGESSYGYVFESKEFYIPKVIYELQRKGIYVDVCDKPYFFQSGEVKKQMGYGGLLVMAKNQSIDPHHLYLMLDSLSKDSGVDIYAVKTGLMKDVDLGSPSYTPLTQPKIAVLVGKEMDVAESGEIWYLLDKRFQMCPTLIERTILSSSDLQRYNVIILADGIPHLTKSSETVLKDWVGNGGTLIATGKSGKWAMDMGLIKLKEVDTDFKQDSTAYAKYADKKEADAGNKIPGTILKCHLDRSHPLAWGLEQDEITIMKNNNLIFKKTDDPYASPLYYEQKPLLSGYLSVKNEKLLRNTPATFVKKYKSGKVIIFVDDMNFRSYWFGTGKIFMNSIIYRECIK